MDITYCKQNRTRDMISQKVVKRLQVNREPREQDTRLTVQATSTRVPWARLPAEASKSLVHMTEINGAPLCSPPRIDLLEVGYCRQDL